MAKAVDLSGMKFNRWLVLSLAESGKNRTWNCVCECGNERVVLGFLLKNGGSKSCGCLYEDTKNNPRSHGMTKTRPHSIWSNMKQRCGNPKNPHYSNYGSRGIGYDPAWASFDVFWCDMQEGYSDELELDRIDVNAGYSKENCRWVDKYTQQYNRRQTSLNTSGRTGVSYYANSDKWEAYITVNGDFIKLGYFNSFEDACSARESAEIKYFGEIKKYA